jgi:ketosteroid isomerase-like protein
MSQRDAEIVRTMLETWDKVGFDETIDAFAPDVELVDLQSAMGMQDRGRGPAELRRIAEQWTEIFDDWRMEIREVVDVGDGWALADVSFHGIGRDSGIPVKNNQFEMYRLVGEKIVEIRVGFHDSDEALAWMRERDY